MFMDRRKRIYIMLMAYVVLATLNQCTVKKAISLENVNRVIDFSGYNWIVRDTYDRKMGPGPNLFSNSEKNVWVDEKGKLHLKIVKRKGEWYCSEVTLDKKVGYGKYIFYINSSLSSLDENIVAGLFTYLNDHQEIDIEFSRWSVPDNENSQYVVQPHDFPDNQHRFNLNDSTRNTVHSFEWLENKITFESSFKDHSAEQHVQQWVYKGSHIPKQSNERLKINLWLYKGKSPQQSGSHELVVDRVEFIPLDIESL